MIRPAIAATLDDLRRLAGELDEADKAIAAHAIRKATAVLAAELRRLGELVPLVLEPQEDDGDPEVPGERIDVGVFGVFDHGQNLSCSVMHAPGERCTYNEMRSA